MNPPSHLGNIEATGDERSIVYATGPKNQPKALIFINFDPAIRLTRMRNWHPMKTSSQHSEEITSRIVIYAQHGIE
jgi:hypothetical protein